MAVRWASVEASVNPQPITETSTTKKVPLGSSVRAKDFGSSESGVGEFVYCLGVASTAVGDFVTIDEAYATARLVPSAVGRVGVAMSANVASQYGWYQVAGKAQALCGQACAADTALFIDAGTTAACDDADVAGDAVHGAFNRTLVGGADAVSDVELSHPHVTNVDYA